MFISPGNPWSFTTRTISTLAGVYTGSSARPSVSAAAILDLRPAAGKFRQVYISSATVTAMTAGNYDGSNFDGATTGSSFAMFGNSTMGGSVKNQTAGALTYAWSAVDVG